MLNLGSLKSIDDFVSVIALKKIKFELQNAHDILTGHLETSSNTLFKQHIGYLVHTSCTRFS